MTLQQMRYAIVIAETNSFNKAAEQLYLSQPSLTESIKGLENELGFEIFNRTSKGVTPTSQGIEFLTYARGVYSQYELLSDKFLERGKKKKKYSVSTQHYSFAVKAFVETVKDVGASEYEFAIKETKTKDVIDDVATLKSEIGILFLSDFNRKTIERMLEMKDLTFTPLIDCVPSVYLWKGHPLAVKEEVSFEDLEPYPCLSFDQGEEGSTFLAEEIFTEHNYPQIIKTNDRASMLNLMVGLNGYTLCSGIICAELNGTDYITRPFISGDAQRMKIGYITKKNVSLAGIGQLYLQKIKEYLNNI